MDRKRLAAADLLELGVKLALDAAEKVLGDPRGREAVGVASELAQKAVRKLEEVQAAVVRAAGVPSREEVSELEERIERLQRRARDLGARLEELSRDERRKGAQPPSEPSGKPSAKPRWRDPDEMEPR
jgi:polyhydroxyalkanoate synthesis regulator phasin